MTASQQFRKKPVVIEAVQLDTSTSTTIDLVLAFIGHRESAGHMPQTSAGRFCWWKQISVDDVRLVIPTLEGDMEASEGDWIIRGVKGELYPCKPDIFAATYETVERGKA